MRKTRVRIVGDPLLVDPISECLIEHFELDQNDMRRFDRAVGRDYSHSKSPGVTYYLSIKKKKEARS